MRPLPRFAVRAAYSLVESFLILNGVEIVSTIYIILLIPRSASKVFVEMGGDFDIHFVEFGMIIKK